MPRYADLSAPLQGALLMICAALLVSAMNLLIRVASAELHVFEIAFFRNLFAFAAMLPWLASVGRDGIRTTRIKLHFLRALNGIVAMVLWFSAVAVLPMAEAVALNFTVPLFATLGAALLLREVVRARRWAATAIGFLGVLIILRPGFEAVTPEMALPILAALFMASSVLLVKNLTRSENTAAVVFYTHLFMTLLVFGPALFVWDWPSPTVWLALLGIGLLGAGSQLMTTRAFSLTDASAVVPFDYMRLPFIAALAFAVYGEVPDFWTWVGGGVIAGAAIYIAQREAQVRKRAKQRAAEQAAEAEALRQAERDTLRAASYSPRGSH